MIISICNEKGGSGKSTLATNLAVCMSKTKQILVIDTDRQKSINTFLQIRADEGHSKIFDYVYRRGDELREFVENFNGNDICIIDTGGKDSDDMRIAIAYSDIAIIPVVRSQFDVSVLDDMVKIIKMAKVANKKLKAVIVINKASTNPFLSKKIDNLKEYIADLIMDCNYISIADTAIFDRERYKLAVEMGLGVVEFDDNDKSKQEIENLCNEILNIKG
ncbi:AAA family ATPase [Campylobacter sp. faydin G-140]|uniref:AAA family ATPase n=1 Tax=Campylobacter anatolicus TaxID=2829105 RepID=UPI001B901373|nr:AAA family ATPase [Campylobacter anatolicus]MBR8466513.1 AAA family ATPase [Campylobacter anatolicus]